MAQKEFTSDESRLFFLDNLRTFSIFLVVVIHAGWVYERSGILSSVWIVNDPSKNDLAGILNIILDILVMPVMFFISGYFTPASLETKKGGSFLKARFKRLMVPWAIAILTLIPLYKVIYLYTRGFPRENFFSYFHFSGGFLINQGWLWFLPVLFLFAVLYFVLWKVMPERMRFSLKGAVFAVFITGFAYSFCMSIFHYTGWTKTLLLDFQNERLLIYFLNIMINTFRYFLNIKGKLLFQLNTYSYGVYIIHFIAMGAVAAILLNTSVSSLAKYAVLIVSTYVISNLIVSFYRGAVQMVGQRSTHN